MPPPPSPPVSTLLRLLVLRRPQELRYPGITTKGGESVDLVVTLNDGSDTPTSGGGCQGEYPTYDMGTLACKVRQPHPSPACGERSCPLTRACGHRA